MGNILGIIVSLIFIVLIIISGKFFEKKGEETSRKFIHILLSNWWFIAMYFFDNAIYAAVVPAIFVIVNYLSYKKDLIGVIEREKKDGLGTVYYALTLLILAIVTFGITHRTDIGLVSVLIMGYGDGLAAVIGKSIKSYEYSVGKSTKTIAGSITMLVVTGIIVGVFLISMGQTAWIMKTIAISIILTITEAISIKGIDNISVPLLAYVLLSII